MRYSKLIGSLMAGRTVPRLARDVAVTILRDHAAKVMHVRTVLRWGLRERQLVDEALVAWTGSPWDHTFEGRVLRKGLVSYADDTEPPASPRHAFETLVTPLVPAARREVRGVATVRLPALGAEAAGEVAYALCSFIQDECADVAIYPCAEGRDSRLVRIARVVACAEELLGVELGADILDDWGRVVDGAQEAEPLPLDHEAMEMMHWRQVATQAAEDLRMLVGDIDDLAGIPTEVWRASALLGRPEGRYLERHCPVWWLAPSYRLHEGHAPVRDISALSGPFACGIPANEAAGRPREEYLLTPSEREGLAVMVAMLLAEYAATGDESVGRYKVPGKVYQLDFDALALLHGQLVRREIA